MGIRRVSNPQLIYSFPLLILIARVFHRQSLSPMIKPIYCRNLPRSPAPYQLDWGQLRSLKQQIDLSQAAPELLQFALGYHHLALLGLEHVPQKGPVVFVCNHTGTPVLAGESLMLETVLLVTHAIDRYTQRSLRPLMGLGYYESPVTLRLNQALLTRLGCVPVTVNNGVRLLDKGESVLVYPEGEESIPPYQTRPFFWGFAKMAWIAEVPIVPVALIGPHESRLRIDPPSGPIVLVAPGRRPDPVPYKLTFLPPVNVRSAVSNLNDQQSLSAFCEQIRQSIQTSLDAESAGRPLVPVAKRLQRLFGQPKHELTHQSG
ncbi:MAG: hypothetical protein DCF15_13005 [Phormidesmis priestleyi]|uniref:Phospholipid/glycerol acyltransferase domain-containing protein n=1 Tax=Phormidesmis priestleyi TaxID=268141 RepID=A0A2W4ZE13_9CYAN|nr:MAG: hypothetical protein DCF15_13005 [Phormidesmis priestleyi]